MPYHTSQGRRDESNMAIRTETAINGNMTNHIYQNHLEQVSEVLSREPFPLPRLEIRDDDRQLHGLAGLLSMRFEHLNLAGYESHAKIAASVAV